MSALTVGLLADTHVPYRIARLPDALFEALAGVDVILHAGDVDDPAALEPLRAIAPVHAVRGNIHVFDLSDGGASLPRTVEMELAGYRMVLTHGHPAGLLGLWLKGRDVTLRLLGYDDNGYFNRRAASRLARLHPEADIVVFGHSHRAHVGWYDQTLIVNPGAVCPTPRRRPTVARMELDAGNPRVRIIPLDT